MKEELWFEFLRKIMPVDYHDIFELNSTTHIFYVLSDFQSIINCNHG